MRTCFHFFRFSPSVLPGPVVLLQLLQVEVLLLERRHRRRRGDGRARVGVGLEDLVQQVDDGQQQEEVDGAASQLRDEPGSANGEERENNERRATLLRI